MELFIQIKNSQAFQHLIFNVNFRNTFLKIDVNNLPSEFARFESVQQPQLSPYQNIVQENPTYEFIDGMWRGVWSIRDMNVYKKIAKQQEIKDAFNNHHQASNWSTWIFNGETCIIESPII